MSSIAPAPLDPHARLPYLHALNVRAFTLSPHTPLHFHPRHLHTLTLLGSCLLTAVMGDGVEILEADGCWGSVTGVDVRMPTCQPRWVHTSHCDATHGGSTAWLRTAFASPGRAGRFGLCNGVVAAL